MIVCFNCSPETKEKLDSLIKSGQYNDYSEAITLAIANLAVLQEEVLELELAQPAHLGLDALGDPVAVALPPGAAHDGKDLLLSHWVHQIKFE